MKLILSSMFSIFYSPVQEVGLTQIISDPGYSSNVQLVILIYCHARGLSQKDLGWQVWQYLDGELDIRGITRVPGLFL